MIFKNLNFNNKIIDIETKKGKIVNISNNLLGNNILDCKYSLLLPPFNDPHIHIDSVFTAGDPKYNESGSLFEGIEIWRQYKKKLNKNNFINRTNKLFEKYVLNGVQNIRAHIDITNDNIKVINWAIEQKNKWKNKINIQITAFPQDGILSTKNGKENLEFAIKSGIDVIGGIPHYEFSEELGKQSIDYILEKANNNNLLVDIHCDEVDDANSKFLEYLSAQTWLKKLFGKVTASHTTAFSRYNNAYVRKLWRSLQSSQINFICNPLINVHLGGRFDSKNHGRGTTRVKEMIKNNINIAYGHDDIQDPWYPLGDGNMMQVLFMGIHLNHLTGMTEIIKSFDLITYNSSKILNIKDYGIKVGNSANFIIMEAKNKYEAIRTISKVKYNVRYGKIINKNS